jgi:hypothetical protein
VDFLLHEFSESDRERIGGLLVREVAVLYAGADQPSPAWLGVLTESYAPSASSDHRARPGEQP